MSDFGWKFRPVFESGAPTVVLDQESLRVEAANQQASELLGRSLDELMGKPLSFLTGSPPEELLDQPQSALIHRPDGDDVPVRIMVLYLEQSPKPALVLRLQAEYDEPDGGSNILETRHVALHRAHRELQIAYNRLELLNDELCHRNQELKEVYRRLSRASRMASIGELVAGTTHGINNPLAAVVSANRELVGHLSLVSDAGSRQKLESLCQRADMGLRRIEGIVTDLRRLAQAGKRREEVKRVCLVQEIDLALDLISHRLKDVNLCVEMKDDIFVRVAPDEFSQVIMNLVDNAVFAMRGKGWLWVRLSTDGAQAVVEIEDDGPGMAPEVFDRAFEPFFSTKEPGSGSGIGLSVAREIVEGLAGSLDVETEQGCGTRVIIRLPREVIHERTA